MSYSTSTHNADHYTFSGSGNGGSQPQYEQYRSYFQRFSDQVKKWEQTARQNRMLQEWRKHIHIGSHKPGWKGHHHKNGDDTTK
ncbi:MAG: hypothetical protein ACLQME_14160 [Alphaproteobacteria bacterium]